MTAQELIWISYRIPPRTLTVICERAHANGEFWAEAGYGPMAIVAARTVSVELDIICVGGLSLLKRSPV